MCADGERHDGVSRGKYVRATVGIVFLRYELDAVQSVEVDGASFGVRPKIIEQIG